MTGLKNISKAEVLTLKDEVAYQKGQVVSKTLAQNAALSVTLFSFDKGEEISAHSSPVWTAWAASPSTARSICSARARASSCPPGIRTRCMGRSHSRCCSSWCSERRA